MKVYQSQESRRILEESGLTNQSYRIAVHLQLYVGWNNAVPSVVKTADALHLPRPSVQRCYAALVEAGFLIRYDGTYRISPIVAWKGKP